MNEITIPGLCDMHMHLRQGAMARHVLPFVRERCTRCIVMPNTLPAIRDVHDVRRYRDELTADSGDLGLMMTLKLLPTTTPHTIAEAGEEIAAVKLYPAGVTTNSDDGIPAPLLRQPTRQLDDVLDAMAGLGIPLLIHGEMPGTFCLDKESEFVASGFITRALERFPKLKIVLEHLSTAEAVRFIRERNLPRLAATITVHHLLITLDDVIDHRMRPHNFCLPTAKRPEDRAELLNAAFSGDPHFFFGSDSAPHAVETKHCLEVCAGCFTAPIMAELLVEVFEKHDQVPKIADFVAHFAQRFYGFEPSAKQLHLVRDTWTVPEQYGNVVPFLAGKQLAWRLS